MSQTPTAGEMVRGAVVFVTFPPGTVEMARDNLQQVAAQLRHLGRLGNVDMVGVGTRTDEKTVRGEAVKKSAASYLAAEGFTVAPAPEHQAVIDRIRGKVYHDDAEIKLTRIEWAILDTLVAAGGTTRTPEQLARAADCKPSSVRTYIYRLREKLAPLGHHLVVNVHKQGLRYAGADTIRIVNPPHSLFS